MNLIYVPRKMKLLARIGLGYSCFKWAKNVYENQITEFRVIDTRKKMEQMLEEARSQSTSSRLDAGKNSEV